jgi:putative SOS response-associated peptidase YedK
MCGRFTLRATPRQLAEFFALLRTPQLEPRPNIAPTQAVLAIVAEETGPGRSAREFHWGLIPSWSKDPRGAAKLINARNETVAEKPAFRAAFRKRRCLIPADGFYEWRKIPGQRKKQPCWIGLRDQSLLAFAGLWEHWDAPDGSFIESCTILTTAANAAVSVLHDRMPVILPPECFDEWLQPGQDPARLPALLRPYPAEEMVLSEPLADELLAGPRPPSPPTLF